MLHPTSIVNTAHGLIGEKTVFIDTKHKPTKRFEFRVTCSSDGVYTVLQRAYRVFASGYEELKSQKIWEVSTLQELLEGQFNQTRQGRLFLQSVSGLKNLI